LLLLLSASLAAQNWVPTFDDEFNGTELDLSHWTPHAPPGYLLTASVPTDSVTVSGGQLHIVARTGLARPEFAGIVTTFGIFAQMYGRFEIRFRMPAGHGPRTGFALWPVPSGSLPRIDILETSDPRSVRLTNYWGNEQALRTYGDAFNVADLSNGFHTVTLEWEPGKITWFVDGKKTFESTDGVPHQPMYLIIDLGGDPAADTNLPASLDIDYVRVYKRAEQ
jgi:beta-glucanase (GH16 family)